MNGSAIDHEGEVTETRRGRVRRLLLDPLAACGFKRATTVTVERHRATMDRLCDDLAYASDRTLTALRDMMRFRGEGSRRDVWPAAAVFYAFAEQLEPRPIVELPGLIRWLRSVEGPRARDAGTLVETWSWWQRMKRPPLHMAARLASDAAENRRQLAWYEGLIADGRATDEQVTWVRGYRAQLAWCEAMVAAGAGDQA